MADTFVPTDTPEPTAVEPPGSGTVSRDASDRPALPLAPPTPLPVGGTPPSAAVSDTPSPSAEGLPEEATTAEAATAEEVPVKETLAPLWVEPSVLDALSAARRALEDKLDALTEAFATKLAIDDNKNQQIDVLHRELQEHKQDLLAKALRPLLSGLVRLHDNLGRVAENLRERPEALVPGEAARLIEEFREDVEILLDENGVALFSEPVDRFEPRRQTARQTLETANPEQVGRIARRARPGFERDGLLLQKERVDVFVVAPVASPATTPNEKTV